MLPQIDYEDGTMAVACAPAYLQSPLARFALAHQRWLHPFEAVCQHSRLIRDS
jgi:hypothetical protein